MNYINAAVGWLWRRKQFIAVAIGSALLFMIWFFPFSDLSQFVTTTIARATGNTVYVQFDSLNMHMLPTPSISATGVSVETTLPAITAQWAKVTPSPFNLVRNLPSILKGEPLALSDLSFSVDAEGLLGAEIGLSLSPAAASERGSERSRVQVMIEDLDLRELQTWADLPLKIQGQGNFETDLLVSPEMQDQPEGDYSVRIEKFNLPAGTVMMPMNGVSMPISLPALSLANVLLKGRMINGNLMIEEGTFGQSQDPLYGRIKGQIGLRLLPTGGGNVAPQLGSYNLTVDISASRAIEKELNFVFLFLEAGKTPTSQGSRYLFRAQGAMMGASPQITRLSSF